MRIHAIETGRVRIKASQAEGRGHGLLRRLAPLFDNDWTDWLPTYAFAIEHCDGVILVDSGANAGLKDLPRWHPYFCFAVRFDVEREQEAGPQLRALGIGPRDVKTIVLTHLHIDHDGGLHDFAASEILVSPGELRAASGLAGQIRGYLPQRWPNGFDPKPLALSNESFGPFPWSRRVTADGAVVAIPTPGHTRDHPSVVVEDGDAIVVIAGDASYTQANLIAGKVDGVSASETTALASLAKLQKLAGSRPTIYLPAHDPQTPERLKRRQTLTLVAQTASQAVEPLPRAAMQT
jgi:glyoxylase-like metal-dependent hydrolase (beta-lactamase superfamily II)